MEKGDAIHVEAGNSEPVSMALTYEMTLAQEKALLRRIDIRLVGTLGVLYCISLMDRTNLGSAVIAGMSVELDLNSVVALVFFVPYVVFQIPSTVIIRKLGPRLHLFLITFLWGGCLIGNGFVKNWRQMVGVRILLGTLEAGFFPGCVYLLSTWYIRYDMHKRYAFFYFIGTMASALSGILAYGLMQMNNLGGESGWRWIFIMEGIITCILGLAGYYLVVDFPENANKSWSFLNDDEVKYIVDRVNKDRGDAQVEPFSLKKYIAAGLDLKVWAFGVIYFCLTTAAYAIAYFLPVILHTNMGFNIAQSQCLVAPPYGFAGILMAVTSWLGDRYRIRGPILIGLAIVALVGLPVMSFAHSNGVKYFGVFLVTGGVNAGIPAMMTYQANNIRGQWKRALCSATLVGFGGLGGIAGSLVFRSQDAPTYRPGIYACIACNILIIILVVMLMIKFYLANKRAARGGKIIEGQEGFRYTL